MRLDTFASRQHLRRNTTTLLSKTPSAHTYRLLVFKEHSLPTAASQPSEPCRFRVAASAAQKRDYVVRFAFRQQVFYSTPDFPIRCEARPAWLCGILFSDTRPALSHFPSPLREAKERNSSARFSLAQGVREKIFSGAFPTVIKGAKGRRKPGIAERSRTNGPTGRIATTI